jgi:NADPH:quinone reductase
MRAALYDCHGASAEVLRVEEIETPEPGPGEVRIKIVYSSVNPTDWKSRSGATARPLDGFQIPHQDGTGVIDAVGEGVDPARIGQRVWIFLAAAGRRWGTAAEWTVVPADHAVPLPDNTSMELGASLGVPAMTAHRCLFADGPVDGTTILVAGGAGAVGHYAIELAKFSGARVIATVSGPEKAELAKAAGADLVLNYREASAADEIKAFGPVDRVVEVALGANLQLDLAVLRPGHVIVTYAADGPDPELPVRACMTANVVLRFMLLYTVPREALDRAAADITTALAAGALTELPVHVYKLEDIAAAQDAVQNGVVGKVLVSPTA